MMIVMIVAVSACIDALVALGAAVYFFAFLPYPNREVRGNHRRLHMKSKLLKVGLSALVLACGAGLAQAGAIRATGKQIGKASAAVAGTTAFAADGAAGGVATAGKATGNAVKGGAPSVGKGIVAAPGLAARGTAKAGKAIWKAVW